MNATEPLGRFARAGTLLITWATKITGLVSASDQLFLHGDHPSSVALAVSAFMMAGAQFSEGLIVAAIDRLLSTPSDTPDRRRRGPGDERERTP